MFEFEFEFKFFQYLPILAKSLEKYNLLKFITFSANKQTRAEYFSNNYYILLLIVMQDIN